jgi:hypothetical protein
MQRFVAYPFLLLYTNMVFYGGMIRDDSLSIFFQDSK